MNRLAAIAAVLLLIAGLSSARPVAAGPQDDIATAEPTVQRALTAAQAGDLATALREYKSYENTWFDVEDGVRDASRDAYRAIEKHMGEANLALTASSPDKDAAVTALTALDTELKRFVAGQPPLDTTTTSSQAATPVKKGEPTVSTLLALIAATRQAVQAGDFATASAQFDSFGDTWVDVEGEIKTRSSSDYTKTENDMARVSTGITRKSTDDVLGVLDGMQTRLQPYENAGNYKPFDATIIVLREGMEALLVVVALLAFVKRSANPEKSTWIWAGAGGGLLASIALGVAIHALLGEAFSGENRELMEGITGLVAAAMLLYVSYWLHSKASLGAWQRYISENTQKALAKGSLMGLALLSFLAVFREGGETVLFLIGMTGKISTGDLFLGLGIGGVILSIIGFLLTVVGVRIPMRPFFTVASFLTFYLCFKFVGAGIHSLQVSGVLSARTASFLPENETLGLYPTWQSTIPQLVLLLAAIGTAVYGRLRDRALQPVATSVPVSSE